MTAAASVLCAALGLASSGCDGCHSEKPYTPFGVTSALPATPSGAPSTVTSAPLSSARPRATPLTPPPGSTRFKVEGTTVQAPEGYELQQLLPFGEGDSRRILAWLAPAKGKTGVPPGELVSFAGKKTPEPLLPFPNFVPQAPGCRLTPRLFQSGGSSVTLGVAGHCETPLLSRVPVESWNVLSPDRSPPLLLSVRLAEAARGEALALEVDSSDQDGDGRDDARLRIVLTAPSKATASAELAFLDRAGGTSRDPAEPRRSLLRGAKALLAKASSSLPSVDAMRRLLASLCAEGETARVFDQDGAPFRCGDLGDVVDLLARAEVLGRLAKKDVLGAAAVLTRAAWYYEPLSADARGAIEKELKKRLLAVTPVATAVRSRPRRLAGPHLAPLWFEADGSLLIQSSAGLVRVARDGSSETPLEPDSVAIGAWPLDVTTASGARLTGASCSCDRSEIELSFVGPDGAPRPGEATELLAPRPGGCNARFACPVPVAVSIQGEQVTAIVAGQPSAAVSLQPVVAPPGGPRSADGRWLVTPSPLGLLVVSTDAHELWAAPAGTDPLQLTDCVVATDRAAIACVHQDAALLLRRP